MSEPADLAFLGRVHKALAEHQALLRQRGEHERAAAVESLSREAWARLLAANRAAAPPMLLYVGPTRHEYAVGTPAAPLRWTCAGAGARALAFASLNPRRWLRLKPGRSRQAWGRAIARALDSLALVDLPTANAMAPAVRDAEPGVRLRDGPEGCVEIKFTPPPPGVATLTPRVSLGFLS